MDQVSLKLPCKKRRLERKLLGFVHAFAVDLKPLREEVLMTENAFQFVSGKKKKRKKERDFPLQTDKVTKALSHAVDFPRLFRAVLSIA